MGKFDAFEKQVDLKKVNEDVEEIKANGGVGDFPEIEKGTYHGKFVKLEVGECGANAKIPGAPLLKIDFQITEGDFKNSHVFMNKVLYTDRNDEKWNMGKLMAGVLGWLETLEPSEDVGDIVFQGYDDFSELILDIAEDIAQLEYDINYDPNKFNAISIEDVFE